MYNVTRNRDTYSCSSLLDKDVLEAMKPWRKLIDEKTKVVVGRTNVDLPRDICRSEECALGNLYTDAMIYAVSDRFIEP